MKRSERQDSKRGTGKMETHEPTKEDPSTDPEAERGEKGNTERHVYIESAISFDIVEKLKEQHKKEREENIHQHKQQLLWTMITALLVFSYTLAAFWQGSSNQRASKAAKNAADTAKEALVRGQRPWVGPLLEPQIAFLRETQQPQLMAALPIKNFGNSPALHLSYYMKFENIGSDIDTPEKMIQTFCKIAEIDVVTTDKTNQDFGFYILPNETGRLLDKEKWVPSRSYNAILGCLAYSDQFHETSISSPIHHTGFCFWAFGTPIDPPKSSPKLTRCNFAEPMN